MTLMPPSLSSALRTAALSLSLFAAACSGPQGNEGPPGPKGDPGDSATVDPNLSPLDKAYAGVGGKAALENLKSFAIQATGERYIGYEGYRPESEAVRSNNFQTTTSFDVEGNRVTIQHSRTVLFFSAQQTFREVLLANTGYLDGTDSAFANNSGNMPSDRWASGRRQQKLLNPHLLLREALANPSRASVGGAQLMDGAIHHLLVLQDNVHPITLYVNASTGRIAKLVTVENDHLLRDVPVEAYYVGWQATTANAPLFPKQVFISVGEHIVHSETRSSITVNGTLDAAAFNLPQGASPVYVEADARRGERSHQYHQTFSGIGVPLDGLQTFIDPVQLATGVWHLRGGSHNSMVVLQSDGVVIIEAPLYQERSQAIIDWINSANSPIPADKRTIKQVLITHFHDDHSAGLRTFVGSGIKVAVGAPSVPFFREVFRAPSTIRPDIQATNRRTPTIDTIPVDGSFMIPDATRPVGAYHVESTHAADLALIYLPNEKIVFISDIFSPNLGPNPFGARELLRAITTHNLSVETIAGGHGTTNTFAQLQAMANP
jgi:glyoxylase-like metal-dependent hydrolase (beta-lactamase superfamily II)